MTKNIIVFIVLLAFMLCGSEAYSKGIKKKFQKTIQDIDPPSPRIYVSDWSFSDLRVGRTAYGDITVKNEGSVELIITDYIGPTLKAYTPEAKLIDLKISPSNPLIIPPVKGNSLKLQVSFSPDAEREFKDSILFISNTDKSLKVVDSIAHLNGRGIKPGLIANSYDWGKRKINRPEFPFGPYPANKTSTQDTCIKLIDSGTESVTVRAIEYPNIDINSYGFILDKTRFLNLTINAMDSIVIPVFFEPKIAGEHELVFKYNNTAGSRTETRLHGIGIVPQLVTSDVSFDSTIINDFNHPITYKIRITNKSLSDWKYGDSVTISGLNIENIYDGNLIENKFGSEAFKFEYFNLRFPIVLQPGEFIEFDAQFVGRKKGLHTAKITTISDAEAEVVSNWTGYGMEQGIEINGDSTTVCIGTPAEMTATVTNTGTTDIRVDSVVFDPNMTEFKWKEPAQTRNFILPAMTSKELVIEFKSDAKGTYQTEIKAYNNTLFDPIVKATITGNTLHFVRSSRIVDPLNSEEKPMPIDRTITRTIVLDPGVDISEAKIKELKIKVNYNGEILKLFPTNVSMGSFLAGKCNIKSAKFIDNPGEMLLTISVTNPSDYINYTEGGEILEFKLGTYPPINGEWSSKITHEIEAISGDIKSPCVDFNMLNSVVHLDSADTSVYKYYLPSINPNPIEGNNGKVDFTVGKESFIEIEIYNINGQLIAKPISKIMPAGRQSVRIPTEIMPPGNYYIRFISGSYSEMKMIVLVK